MPRTWSDCSGGLSGTTSEQVEDWPRLSWWEQPCDQLQESRAGSKAESAQ